MNSIEEPIAEVTPKKKRKPPTDYGDLTGHRFGKLTVLEKVKIVCCGSTRPGWKCLCDCGKEKVFRSRDLAKGNVASCGCSHYIFGSEHPCWKGCGNVSSSYWSEVRRRAAVADLPFTLSIEDMNNLLIAQGMKCALSGLPIETQKRSSGTWTASLDRIDSSKGYTLDNVQWVHNDINFMKQEFDQNYFIDLCRRVNEHTLQAPPNLTS